MNLVLHHWRKFGRILVNYNMWFGCCHNGGRFSPQCTFFEFRTRVRVISWYEKALNPTRREGWRLWRSSWPLVICASWHSSLSRWSNCFVNANIKRDEPPHAKGRGSSLWAKLRANRSSAALFLSSIILRFYSLSRVIRRKGPNLSFTERTPYIPYLKAGILRRFPIRG